MPGAFVHTGALIGCPHGGGAQFTPGNTRVRVVGEAVLIFSDVMAVGGCLFTVADEPRPCVRIDWVTAATRVKIRGVPVILQDSSGVASGVGDTIPRQGVTIANVQQRVRGI